MGALPEVGVVDVIERDADGELYVKLTKGEDAPLVVLAASRKDDTGPAPGIGDRLLVRFVKLENVVDSYERMIAWFEKYLKPAQ